MSIQTELTRLTNAKAAIQTAIEGKGVTVPSGTLLDGMAALIESIEAGGGMKVEVFSLTPVEEIPKGTYEIGETTITNPHFCVCFDGTLPDTNNDTDTKKYYGFMTYVGCDATLWGEIGSAYNKASLGLLYRKDVNSYSYKRHIYGSGIQFNKTYTNGFYVDVGKLYSNSGSFSSTRWLFEAGHTYYVLLIGE